MTEPAAEKPPPTLPVDQKWLQDLINKECGTNEEIKDVKCEIIGEGKGFLSTITKATIEWSNNGKGNATLPKGVVFKQPTDEKIKAIPMMAQFFEDGLIAKVHNTELAAYDYFTKYKPAPFPMARCFYKEKMTDVGTGMMILEVVEGRSLTFNEDNTIEQMFELAEHIAGVQAYSFLHPDYHEYIKKMPFNGFQMMRGMIPANAKVLREKFPNLFTVSDEDIEKGIQLVEKATELMLNPEKSPYTKVVALGDMQPNNVLWKTNPDGSLSNKVQALIDLQICHEGSCFNDLAAVVNWGMSVEEHEEHMDSIIDHYYKTLVSKLGDVPCPVTLDEIKTGYKGIAVMYPVVMINMACEMDSLREVFGFTQDRIECMVKKITHGFSNIDSPEVTNFGT